MEREKQGKKWVKENLFSLPTFYSKGSKRERKEEREEKKLGKEIRSFLHELKSTSQLTLLLLKQIKIRL